MGLIASGQSLFQGEALALLCQNLRGVGIGQMGEHGLVYGVIGDQLLAAGVGLPCPCDPGVSSHQGQDSQQHPAPLHSIDLHANTLSDLVYSA